MFGTKMSITTGFFTHSFVTDLDYCFSFGLRFDYWKKFVYKGQFNEIIKSDVQTIFEA